MSLHTGQAEMREGDYFGGSLNRAARLMSLAYGGQVLLSNTTGELVRERPPEGVSLLDLGEHRLKDLVRPERVFQLNHPSLNGHFPPLPSLDSFPNNLPVQLTSFVGRERELAGVKERLDSARLLTLIGPGGTGKTRLSLQLAADVLPTFADGAWLVELAALADPALILQSIASVFHVREQMGMSLEENVLNYLRAKHLLLILDNCEHMVEACARLADQFLHACPRIKIIASSREALGITGEVVYRVPSLSLPHLDDQITPEALAGCESAQLFLERARLVDPKFQFTDRNAAAIAQACNRLDGIPLALELAAARVTVFTPEQIASRLDDRFKLLTGGSRTALPRQQTLRALIDWSHEILSEEERALFRRLSVFVGGWTFEAAEAICGDLPMLDLLTQLVNKSLVMADDQGNEKRYRFLETIRQYARDKLLEAGEAEQMRNSHMEFFLQLAELAGPRLDTEEVMEWIARLEAEYDNFRAAFEWALGHDPQASLRFVGSLAYFWFRRGHGAEGIQWGTEALERAEKLPSQTGEETTRAQMEVRARALQALSLLHFSQGDNAQAVRAGEACAALARQMGDRYMLAFVLTFTGSAKGMMGDRAGSLQDVEEAVRLAREEGKKHELAQALGMLAMLDMTVKRDFKAGRAYEQESLSLLKESPLTWSRVMVLFGLGRGAMFRGDYALARERFARCLPVFEQMGDEHRVNMIRSELAHMDRHEGRYEQAEHAYRKTILVWQKLGHRAAIAHQLECFAFLARAREDGERAARLFGAAEALRKKINIRMNPLEQVEHEAQVEGLHAGMGKEQLMSLWEDGRSMAMEDAIQYALS
jgi:predicted ATPase